MQNTHMQDEFTTRVREALLHDARILRLLGGANVFVDAETEDSSPCISIGATSVTDECLGKVMKGARTLTLQFWPRTKDSELATSFIGSAEQALKIAGLIDGDSDIQLVQEFAGTRRLPDEQQLHCILRYHATRRDAAA